MTSITLDQAMSIVDDVLERARTAGLKPIAVAVLDAGGQLIAFKRQDQQSMLRSDIAVGKAWGALSMGLGGRALVARASANPHFYNSMIAMANGKMVVGIGSVLIRDAAGRIVGAVGVSGDSSDNDERCAVGGVEDAGFKADTGAG